MTEFAIPTMASSPQGITAGPDGNLWFAESNAGKIGRIGTGSPNSITEFSAGFTSPVDLVFGPDGNLWFAESGGNNIGRVNLSEGPTPTASLTPPASPTPIATPMPTATAPPPRCAGDCDADGVTTVGELIQGVNITLGMRTVQDCPSLDADGSETIGVHELIVAVSFALRGCPGF